MDMLTRDVIGLRPPTRRTPLSTPVRRVVIHHGAGSSTDPVRQWRAYQRVHMGIRHWSDIAYNYGIGARRDNEGSVMSTRIYQVDSNSSEVVPVRVTTVADPTGGDPPEFAFAQSGEPVSFVAGTWGAWTAARSEAIALTPTLPAATATIDLADGRWQVWVRFDVGGETVVESPGVLVVA